MSVTEINKDSFWALIDEAKKHPGSSSEWLLEQLASMGPEQAKKFDTIARVYMDAAYQYGLWNAACVMEQHDCSDDGFIDFRAWLVGQGRKVYMDALKDPDSLASAPSYQDCQFDSLPRIGSYAYEELTGRDAFQDFDPDEYHALEAEVNQEIEYGDGIGYPYTWSDTIVYLPKLCARYMTPEELDRHIQQRNDTWNIKNPDIRSARNHAKKSKKIRKNRGESR